MAAPNLRADLARTLAETLSHAIASGDTRTALATLEALRGLVDEAPSDVAAADVVGLRVERKRRGR